MGPLSLPRQVCVCVHVARGGVAAGATNAQKRPKKWNAQFRPELRKLRFRLECSQPKKRCRFCRQYLVNVVFVAAGN